VSRTLLAGLAAALLLALGALPGPASAKARRSALPVPHGFVGVVVDPPTWPEPSTDLSQQLDTMVASGVESIRVVFDWSQAQPYASWSQVPAAQRGQFVSAGGVPTDFSSFDALVAAAAARRMTVLPVIQNAPGWDGQNYKGGIVTLARTPGPYAAFARALVERYGHRGSFWRANPQLPKVPITMWQIWNEPNIPAFWPPRPYYARYVALLRAAHAAIKAADPKAKVVLAGLPNFSWIEIARIDRFRGASRLYDVVALHPYTKTPQGVITIIGYVRKVLDSTGAAGKPILADEISWPSSRGKTTHDTGYDFATTQAGQAKNVGQALRLLAANRIRLGIAGFYYYDWAGQDRPNFLAFDFAGLFHFADGQFQPKPAYNVFRSGALHLEGCRAKGPTATACAH
jgi:hypothetical protein